MAGADGRLKRAAGQKTFWDAMYHSDPEFFGPEESPFARWSVPFMKRCNARSVLELGFGYGRDIAFLRRNGFELTGVELSSEGMREASRRFEGDQDTRLVESDALTFLGATPSGKYDAVYSNLFLNMHFTREEHQSLFKEIARVLKRGGLHLFSVRSTSDPWYGKGRHVGPDTFDHSPFGSTLVYFSAKYIQSVTPLSMTTAEQVETEEGAGDFPIRVLYVVQVRERGSVD